MGFVKTGISALGKLAVVAGLLAAFLAAMAGVVYMSLSGKEISVPEITGKDFFESEKELAALGLKIKRRADRPSTEKLNTVLEQLPKAGETVKTGQLIFVVVSKAGVEGEDTQKTPIKDIETDDTEKIKDMISEKPKKARSNSNSNSNANAKKKGDANLDAGNSNSEISNKANSRSDDKDKKDKEPAKAPVEKGNKNTSPGTGVKVQPTPAKSGTKETRIRNPQRP